jgi:MFS family permease
MTAPLAPAAARRALLLLTATRWLPVGLVVGILTLLPLERGLDVAQALAALSLTGVAVLVLELPSSGFADAFGRRPVFLAAATVNVLAAAVYLVADRFSLFALAAVLMGVFRALDSGPLEAWYVDTVHASEPGADVDGALSAQSAVLGVAIAAGAVASGALVWWHPVAGASALGLPTLLWVLLNILHLVAGAALMHEPQAHLDRRGARRALHSAAQAPAVVREGLSLLSGNAVLRGIVGVEAFWAVAMVVFETFQPIRLAELVGGRERAGAVMGPVAAAGWAAFAGGAALAGLASRRIGVAGTAILARVLNGAGAVLMGLVAGPAALVGAYLLTYGLHGGGGPVHNALLHREAAARNRATVLSMNSMTMFAAYSVAAPLLGLLADRASTQAAMAAAGAVSLLGAGLYLPALRQERRRARAGPPP